MKPEHCCLAGTGKILIVFNGLFKGGMYRITEKLGFFQRSRAAFLCPAVAAGVRHCAEAEDDASQDLSLPLYTPSEKKKKIHLKYYMHKPFSRKFASHSQAPWTTFQQAAWSPPTMPHKRFCSQPETLIFKHKIKLERLAVPALGSTFLSSFPNLVPRGQSQPSVLLHTSKTQFSMKLFGLLCFSPSSSPLHIRKPTLLSPGAVVALPQAPKSWGPSSTTMARVWWMTLGQQMERKKSWFLLSAW